MLSNSTCYILLLSLVLILTGCPGGSAPAPGQDTSPDALVIITSDLLADLGQEAGLVDILPDLADDAPADTDHVDISLDLGDDAPADTDLVDISLDLAEDAPADIVPDGCLPDCSGMNCGEDGCGGSCGTCGNSDLCDGQETCQDGLCSAGVPLDCDDGNTCTDDDCEPLNGCLHLPNTSPCDDGLACNNPDTCQGGICTGDETGCDKFSVILLPDTQYYADKLPDGPSNTYYKQTQWIVDNQEDMNIQFAVHLGDVTNGNTVDEWEVADGAHQILDDAGVPYTMVPGNHDYYPKSTFTRGQTMFNNWFGPDRFQDEPWYGGSYGSKNDNNYALFEVAGVEFMVLSVEFAPRKDVLCWANDIIASHPTRRVIIATHCYLTHNGAYSMSCATGYDISGSSGLTVWKELASRHSNIFMVVSGHVGDSEYVPILGNAGNTVHQMLVDYQFEATCTGGECANSCHEGLYTGNGWLRRLVFAPAENQIYSETWTVEAGNQSVFPQGSPTFFCGDYDSDPSGPDHVYAFSYDLTSPLPPYQYVSPESTSFMDRTVNSVAPGNQLGPVVAMNGNGDIVVVWEDNSSDDDGNENFDIFARGLQPGGCESFHDIAANAPLTAGQQEHPAAAMDAAGGFVVAYRDDNDGNGKGQIYARGFDGDGNKVFSLVPVNSVSTGEQRNPALGMAPDGTFVVAWEDDSNKDDGSGNYDIHARVFAPNGGEKVADLIVNIDTDGQQLAPAVAMAPNGDFIVAWEDDKDGNGTFQIYARGFNEDGTPKFGPFTVNSVNTGQQLAPAIAVDDSGRFVVVWEDDSNGSDGSGNHDIFARGFDAGGAETFSDLPVNGSPAGHQRIPAIAGRPDGNFVVVWEDDSDNNGAFQIYARGFDSSGAEIFPEATVNSESEGQQLRPSVGVDATGLFVVAWEDDMDKNGVFQIMARGLDW
jgi:hypothetical protein